MQTSGSKDVALDLYASVHICWFHSREEVPGSLWGLERAELKIKPRL